MNAELWERLKPLFHAALERDPTVREAYIEEVCAQDEKLKEHLRRLLKAEQEATAPACDPAGIRTASQDFSHLRSGEPLLGRFHILRLVGSGGMGEVYEAEDLELGIIALKTIRADIADSPDALRWLRSEVQLARKVSAPQICRLHELFSVPAAGSQPATAFITMEFIDGVTLSSRIESEGPFPFRQALPIALEICEALGIILYQLVTGVHPYSTRTPFAAAIRRARQCFGLRSAHYLCCSWHYGLQET